MFEIIISDCKLYYRAIIIEQGHVHQLNTADSWKLNTATDVKNHALETGQPFQQMVLGKLEGLRFENEIKT